MSRTVVECVPNFSEGRDPAKVAAIVEAIRSAGVVVLNQTSDRDHNRSVVTFAGPAETVAEAAFRGVAKAVELIDLRVHQGVHPRLGAADVVPFVPVRGATLEHCVRLAEAVGRRIWDELRVPVYFYEAAARRPERRNLEDVRRGQFEGVREELRTNPDRRPDVGEDALHPSAGAVIVGARKFLIAYNINLDTPDVGIAKRVARAVRASSGGLAGVKALGLPLATRNLAQVSLNLTDFEITPVHRVFEAVRGEAARLGAGIAGSEIIGLIPRKAIEIAAEWFLQIENFQPGLVLENRLEECMEQPGLADFLEEIASPQSATGGGSAAAGAGAMSAALGSLVSRLAGFPDEPFEADRRFFAEAARRDAQAWQRFLRSENTPEPDRQAALLDATRVPLEVAEETACMAERLRTLASLAPPRLASDVAAARSLATAALDAATAIVRSNIIGLRDRDAAREIEQRLEKLQS